LSLGRKFCRVDKLDRILYGVEQRDYDTVSTSVKRSYIISDIVELVAWTNAILLTIHA
jgi:hypothetical protein